MRIEDFETAKEFLESVLKLKIIKAENGFALNDRKELVNFCYNQEEVIEHAQYELETCLKIIRECSEKQKLSLWFYHDLLNFTRTKGFLLII